MNLFVAFSPVSLITRAFLQPGYLYKSALYFKVNKKYFVFQSKYSKKFLPGTLNTYRQIEN